MPEADVAVVAVRGAGTPPVRSVALPYAAIHVRLQAMIRRCMLAVTMLLAMCIPACGPMSSETQAQADRSEQQAAGNTTGEAKQSHGDVVPSEAAWKKTVPAETLAFVIEMEQGQMEMEAEALADMKEAEQALQSLLKRMQGMIRGTGPRSTKARDLLVASQAAWQNFASAQIALEWPDPAEGRCGSVHGMCRAQRWTVLVNDRIKQLKAMIETEEGDVCFARWPDDED